MIRKAAMEKGMMLNISKREWLWLVIKNGKHDDQPWDAMVEPTVIIYIYPTYNLIHQLSG